MSAVDSTQSSTSTNTSAASTTSGSSSLANKTVFLQLLVAQLKNQDPMNPSDSTTFITQLAQFSSLEQLTSISSDVGSIKNVVSPPQTSSSSGSGT